MRDIRGYEGIYAATSDGRIVSRKTGRALKPFVNTGGYLRVNLHKAGKTSHKYVHRLIAEAFLPNPEKYPEVDHLNADRQDNRAVNLRWCDRHGNVQSALAMGHWRRPLKLRVQNILTGEVRYYAFAKHASQDIFGNTYSLNYCRKRYGDKFEKAGWRFEVVKDEVQTP